MLVERCSVHTTFSPVSGSKSHESWLLIGTRRCANIGIINIFFYVATVWQFFGPFVMSSFIFCSTAFVNIFHIRKLWFKLYWFQFNFGWPRLFVHVRCVFRSFVWVWTFSLSQPHRRAPQITEKKRKKNSVWLMSTQNILMIEMIFLVSFPWEIGCWLFTWPNFWSLFAVISRWNAADNQSQNSWTPWEWQQISSSKSYFRSARYVMIEKFINPIFQTQLYQLMNFLLVGLLSIYHADDFYWDCDRSFRLWMKQKMHVVNLKYIFPSFFIRIVFSKIYQCSSKVHSIEYTLCDLCVEIENQF